MKPTRKKQFLSSVFAVAFMALTLVPSVTVGQEEGPVKFQYAGDMKAKWEGEKFYIYLYCNKYEGDSCTSSEGAMRIHIPKPSGWLTALVKIK